MSLPFILLVMTYFIGQTYEYFDNAKFDSIGEVNWIFFEYKPMLISWNVKFLSEEINWFLMSYAFYITAKKTGNNLLRWTGVEFMTYRAFDIVMWFLNFKTHYYWVVFFVLAILQTWLWYRKPIVAFVQFILDELKPLPKE